MVADARRELDNGTREYVTKREHLDDLEQLTSRFLESHQELRNDNHVLSEHHGQIMAELSEIREDIFKLSQGEKLERKKVREKLRSLPNLVAKEVEKDREITAITNLRKEVAASKKRANSLRSAVIALVVGAGGIILAEVIIRIFTKL